MMLALVIAASLAQPGLADGGCDGVVVIEEFEGASLRGECSTRDSQRVLAVTVSSDQAASAGTLKSFEIGFCRGSVARAMAPEGWTVTLHADGRGVTFSRGGDEFDEPGVRSGAKLGGFVIELRPGWRYAHEARVDWENTGLVRGTDHACLSAG